MFVEKS